jgi:hypothetical protein
MMESSGFPVLPGHAHPLQKIAPFNFFSRGTSYINHAQSRGLFYLFCMYIYQNQKKMASIKEAGRRLEVNKNISFRQAAITIYPRNTLGAYPEINAL